MLRVISYFRDKHLMGRGYDEHQTFWYDESYWPIENKTQNFISLQQLAHQMPFLKNSLNLSSVMILLLSRASIVHPLFQTGFDGLL